MSRFYGSMQGGRGPVTRQGTEASGLTAHVRGWNLGIEVEATTLGGRDAFRATVTRGSNGHGKRVPTLLTVTTDEDGRVVVTLQGEGPTETVWREDAPEGTNG